MADISAKQLALHAVQELPDDATFADAMERLFLLEKIERGRADIRQGRAITHEEIRLRFDR
jgi:predicted transcriptional regulator